MAKALIICVAGMSSSLMAKKTTEYFEKQGKDIQVDAINANEAKKVIENKEFDLYLVSPQAKM
ncbi:cellobiose-specific phosphotransferase system component IIB [Streptococcus loxodontisalivarius]|uniref:Cellobiose-specific phosphotransferase system component IIB n=1 Tax=Streptococcus loxodontisalivarius TaxID=1349415 RepID=A0ABS2PUT5_9STRE|nr:cellobiose-specific phosphotransferase system component IIB [Streptococcus loxodontisalivarius]